MKAICILALLAIASPAFAQAPAEKQNALVQYQKPFLYDKLLPNDVSPPAPTDHPLTTITSTPSGGQLPPAQPIITPYSGNK